MSYHNASCDVTKWFWFSFFKFPHKCAAGLRSEDRRKERGKESCLEKKSRASVGGMGPENAYSSFNLSCNVTLCIYCSVYSQLRTVTSVFYIRNIKHWQTLASMFSEQCLNSGLWYNSSWFSGLRSGMSFYKKKTQLLFQRLLLLTRQFQLKHTLHLSSSKRPSGCSYSFTPNSNLWHLHFQPIQDVFTKTFPVT